MQLSHAFFVPREVGSAQPFVALHTRLHLNGGSKNEGFCLPCGLSYPQNPEKCLVHGRHQQPFDGLCRGESYGTSRGIIMTHLLNFRQLVHLFCFCRLQYFTRTVPPFFVIITPCRHPPLQCPPPPPPTRTDILSIVSCFSLEPLLEKCYL